MIIETEEPDPRRPGELRRNMHMASVIMRDELDVAEITREEFEERCRTKWTRRNREEKERHLRKIWSLLPDGDVGGFPHIQALYDLRKEIASAKWWVAVDRRDPYPEWHIGDREGEPPLAHWACPDLAWLDDALKVGRATQILSKFRGCPDVYAVRSEDLPPGRVAIAPGEVVRVATWDVS